MSFDIIKGWGRELIFADTPEYCGKLLIFDKAGNKCSFHFHLKKDENWFVAQGSFELHWIDTETGDRHMKIIKKGEDWHNPPGLPHRLVALEDNSIVFEVSTQDDEDDSLRIEGGDNQIKPNTVNQE